MLQFLIMLILASNSPRRKEMLNWLGVEYQAHPAHIDETPEKGESPLAYVARMSSTKVRSASRNEHVTLGADTIVVYKDEILGKPNDAQDAHRILELLRNRYHKVHTALCLYGYGRDINVQELCSSDVKMRGYSDDEIKVYIKSNDPMDKAGAYAIQHPGFHPVVNFHGCMANVMGLPLCHLKRGLKIFGVEVEADIAAICMRQLNYDCGLSGRILNGENLG